MHTDSLFYRLFQNWPELALILLQLDYQPDSYRFTSEEIKQTGFRIDGIFKPTQTDSAQPLIFVEVQYQPDAEFFGRFFTEISLYLYRHKPGRHWLALIIYPTRNVEKPPATEFEFMLNLPQFKRIYLEDYQETTEPDYAMLRLISCREEHTAEQVKQLLAEKDALSPELLEFIETVLVYKLPNLSREEIRIMLALNDVKLKQTRFYQEIAAEERSEGRLEGKLEGEVQIIVRQLNRRFGVLPTWAQQKLAEANNQQLELWSERLLDAKTLDEIFN
jgi:predicted transposase/invertase (TIGR01784 family)